MRRSRKGPEGDVTKSPLIDPRSSGPKHRTGSVVVMRLGSMIRAAGLEYKRLGRRCGLDVPKQGEGYWCVQSLYLRLPPSDSHLDASLSGIHVWLLYTKALDVCNIIV